MKRILKIFCIVILAEIILKLLSMLLQLDGNPAWIHAIGSMISVSLSMPLVFIDRSYPYWAMGGIGFSLMLIFITLVIHTFFAYLFYWLIKTLLSK